MGGDGRKLNIDGTTPCSQSLLWDPRDSSEKGALRCPGPMPADSKGLAAATGRSCDVVQYTPKKEAVPCYISPAYSAFDREYKCDPQPNSNTSAHHELP